MEAVIPLLKCFRLYHSLGEFGGFSLLTRSRSSFSVVVEVNQCTKVLKCPLLAIEWFTNATFEHSNARFETTLNFGPIRFIGTCF